MPAARPSTGCGVLCWFVPPALAGEVTAQARAEQDAALAAAGKGVPRRRVRLLPPAVALYFTLALCLSASLPYREVMRSLAGPLALAGWAVPASTALTAARRRLGERPLELLFWRVAGPIVTWREPWAACGGLLLVAWDGTTLAAPASPENVAALGLPGTGAGGRAATQGHYPRARVVALVACGTRALLGAARGPLAAGGP